MKVVFFSCIGVLTMLSVAHASDCHLQAKVKTARAASGIVNGVSFSKKQLEALSAFCTVAKVPMTKDELVAFETQAFDKKIARIKKTTVATKN